MPKEPTRREYRGGRASGWGYKQGHSVLQMKDAYAQDMLELDLSQLVDKWGPDPPRFLETGDNWRPNSTHLRSPSFECQYGIEYTPYDAPRTDSLFARIPHSAALKARRDLQQGHVVDAQQVGVYCFPPPGTVLRLTRVWKGQRATERERAPVVEATVRDIVEPKRASAEVQLVAQIAVPPAPGPK
jgi:hypothetical protein